MIRGIYRKKRIYFVLSALMGQLVNVAGGSLWAQQLRVHISSDCTGQSCQLYWVRKHTHDL